MSKVLFAALASVAASGFLNTNAGKKLFFCSTPQPTDLTQSGYEALTWIEVKGVGSHGATGPTTNLLSYPTWDSDVTQKAKGLTDAGSPEIELIDLVTDPGQVALRAAALTRSYYAFKILGNDAVGNGTPTIRYNRGLVSGPTTPNGKNEDFDLIMFALGLVQRQLEIPATAGS